MFHYKFLSIILVNSRTFSKYEYSLESLKYFKITFPISFCLTFIYFGILLNIYVKHDFDSKKFSNNEYYLTRIILLSLFLFIIILILTYLFIILSHHF